MKNCTVTLKNPLANVLAVITYTHTHSCSYIVQGDNLCFDHCILGKMWQHFWS